MDDVRRAVGLVDIGYPDSVVVDYYDADGEWFEYHIDECTASNLRNYPGVGVGRHCLPVDPYLPG